MTNRELIFNLSWIAGLCLVIVALAIGGCI